VMTSVSVAPSTCTVEEPPARGRKVVEMPAEELEHLGHVFLQVSQYAVDKADRRGFDVSPPESDEFFAALSEAVIAALEFSGEDSATEFATGLRSDWPRTDRLLSDGTMLPVGERSDLTGGTNGSGAPR